MNADITTEHIKIFRRTFKDLYSMDISNEEARMKIAELCMFIESITPKE